ncbi:MAG: hypothetical protein JWO87_1973 [Phycisphaerales bacterium]|jgi:pimeloyl-ACP methyl ester carboxylesterase|nr:hypothetical protein [Phycisphaerales bacterium]MDB5304176.1 hypothetical protein [Phycisphaerales bacterium]
MAQTNRVVNLSTSLRAIIALCLLLCTCGCVGDRLILGSNSEKIDPAGAHRQIVRANGRAVECWVARSPGAKQPGGRQPEAFLLVFIGKGDRADRWIAAVADAWGGRAVEVWGMNYAGSGGSEGPPQLSRVGPDALETYDAIRRIAVKRPIFIQAGSFGTTAALCVAARRPISGLVLQNPPPLRQLILGHYGWWNLWLLAGPAALQIPPDLDSLANAARVRSPAVFIMAGDDEVIPPPYQNRVYAAYAGPKRRIDMPGARHSDPLTREAAEEFANGRDWLWHSAGLQ